MKLKASKICTACTYCNSGREIDIMDGVESLALSPLREGDRFLYFHAYSSTTENVVRTSVLRNDSFIDDPYADSRSISVFPEERPSQSAAEAMDRDGILFFGLMKPPSMWYWNSATEYCTRNFHEIASDKEPVLSVSGVKVVNNLQGEQELWVLSSSFQRVMTGMLPPDKVNFIIHAQNVSRLLDHSSRLYGTKERNRDNSIVILLQKIITLFFSISPK